MKASVLRISVHAYWFNYVRNISKIGRWNVVALRLLSRWQAIVNKDVKINGLLILGNRKTYWDTSSKFTLSKETSFFVKKARPHRSGVNCRWALQKPDIKCKRH